MSKTLVKNSQYHAKEEYFSNRISFSFVAHLGDQTNLKKNLKQLCVRAMNKWCIIMLCAFIRF